MEDVLSRLGTVIDATAPKLEAISEETARVLLKEGGWSRKQVLGHLIDSAANNHQRFVRCTLDGGLKGWPGYDTPGWVNLTGYHEMPWASLISLWAGYNRLLLHLLSRIPAEALPLRCQFGTWDMSLEEVARDYVVHMEHHLGQIFGKA